MKINRLSLLTLVCMQAVCSAKEFSGVGGTHRYVCKPGESVSVEGVSQRVSLSGPCKNLEIDGKSATVSVQQVESIVVNGASNVVRFGSNAAGAKPVINISGVGNSSAADAALRRVAVAAGTPAASTLPASAASMIASPDNCSATQTVEGVSNGQNIQCAAGARILFSGVNIKASVSGNCAAICVSGTGNQINVQGDALAIAIDGASNVVSAARVDAVSVEGMSNAVSYASSFHKTGPKFSNEGISNSVRPIK